MVETFVDAEAAARVRLEPELRRHADLAIVALNLMANVANAAPPPVQFEAPKTLHVGLILLLRVTNDLRCAFLLAETGYPMQAASLVASMHEAAYTIPYIGSDEALAQEWHLHDNPTRPFRDTAELTRCGVINLGTLNPVSEATRVYKKYTQLCWAKHILPFAEREVSLAVEEGEACVLSGPNTTEAGIRAAWFALEQGVWYAYVAIRSIIHFHLADRIGDKLDAPIQDLFNEYVALHAAFVERWGNEDPFPGRWRDIGKQIQRA